MKRFFNLSLLLLAFACNDDDNGTPPPGNQNTSEPFPTEIGVAIGSAVTAEIGESGGSISSEDGMLEVVVPQGAVSATTTFGILPVISFCPGGLNTYRLLPEGVTFEKPVSLVFHYNDDNISGTLPELLGIAYQASDKVWYTLPNLRVDETLRTVSVDVKHFTDWTLIEHLNIFPKVPAIPELRITETIDLAVIGQGMSQEADDLPPLPREPGNSPAPEEDELPPLPAPRPFRVKWFVNNVENGNDRVGRIKKGDAVSHLYVYTAPATTPAEEIVTVTAEITGLKKWTLEGGAPKISSSNKVILLKQIRIKPDEYNYSLRIEHKDDYYCGYQGQVFQDAVKMDVHVKGEVVSVLNIENQEPSVNPLTMSVFGCSLTCEPGSIGELNVTSGTGKITKTRDRWLLELDLQNRGLTEGGVITFSCPESEDVIQQRQAFDHAEHLTFVLADSTQHGGSPPGEKYGIFITLTPKK